MTFVTTARAGVVTRPVEYTHGDVVLEGYLAYDDAIAGKRPAVLVVHEWWGLNAFAKKWAEELAAMGYVGFAVDMYGKGVLTDDAGQASQLAARLRGKPIMRERIQAGLDVVAKHELVDPKRIGAIGFCFGGTTVLELAYSGAPVAGVVSFHGGLTVPKGDEGKGIKAKILVCHGADDPFVPPEQVASFEQAMRDAGVDWQLIAYGGAVHSFTSPEADGRGMKGVAYHRKAAERSKAHMVQFFKEVFGTGS